MAFWGVATHGVPCVLLYGRQNETEARGAGRVKKTG